MIYAWYMKLSEPVSQRGRAVQPVPGDVQLPKRKF